MAMSAGAAAAGRVPGVAIESPEAAAPAVSDDEKAKADAAAAEQSAKDKSGNFVLYLGPSNAVRAHSLPDKERAAAFQSPGVGSYAEITATQWREVGIAADQTLTWSLQNNYRIPVSQFSKAQLDYLLDKDGHRFALVDAEGKQVQR